MAIFSKNTNTSESEEEEDEEQLEAAVEHISQHVQNLTKINKELKAIENSQAFLLANVSRLLTFQEQLVSFLPKVKEHIEKYSIESEDYNEEKLMNAFVCRDFIEVVKMRFKSCMVDGKLVFDNGIFALCDDLVSIQDTMDGLLQTLD